MQDIASSDRNFMNNAQHFNLRHAKLKMPHSQTCNKPIRFTAPGLDHLRPFTELMFVRSLRMYAVNRMGYCRVPSVYTN